MSSTPEPAICIDCGKSNGRFDPTAVSVGTFWAARCGWCGEIKSCTSPADYGFPEPPAREVDHLDD